MSWSFWWKREKSISTMRTSPNLSRLPPHLSEVCKVLAVGLLRLRRHIADAFACDEALLKEERDVSLHFAVKPSGHAKPRDKEIA